MTVAKIGDLLSLDEGQAFKVLETIEIDGESYVYAVEVTPDFSELFDPTKIKSAFLKESISDNDEEYFVEQVQDESLIEKLRLEVMHEIGHGF